MAPVSHPANGNGALPSPYVELDRAAWARLRENQPLSLDADDLTRLRGLGDRIDLTEVEEVYLPLSRLLNFYVGATARAAPHHRATSSARARPRRRSSSGSPGRSPSASPRPRACSRSCCPAGRARPRSSSSPPTGSSTQRRARAPKPVAAQGFPGVLRPPGAAAVRGRGQVRQGRGRARRSTRTSPTTSSPASGSWCASPTCSSSRASTCSRRRDCRSDGRSGLAVSDFFDFSVYVDAHLDDIRQWYVERFLRLRETAFADPDSYFHRYAALSDEQARETAARHLARDQRGQPARERPAHPQPGHPGAGQGQGPQRPPDPAPQALRCGMPRLAPAYPPSPHRVWQEH